MAIRGGGPVKVHVSRGLWRRGVSPWPTIAAWLAEAEASEPSDPTAMQLATVGADGRPSVRTVLVRHVDEGSVTFFTNYGSRKSRDMEGRPHVAGVIHHKRLARQIHIEGRAAKALAEVSDAYFGARDRGSQIGAWASRQSAVLPSRDVLKAALAEAESRFAGGPVPRPPFWGGWRIEVDRVELWQGRPSRLHDRDVFERASTGWLYTLRSP